MSIIKDSVLKFIHADPSRVRSESTPTHKSFAESTATFQEAVAGVIKQALGDVQKRVTSNKAFSQETSATKLLTVYVRRDGQARTLSFNCNDVPELTDEVAVNAGLAVDGNQFVIAVTADKIDRDGGVELSGTPSFVESRFWRGGSLHANLAATQAALMEWLKKLGYSIRFD
jgi:hypothetical protein